MVPAGGGGNRIGCAYDYGLAAVGRHETLHKGGAAAAASGKTVGRTHVRRECVSFDRVGQWRERQVAS